MLHNVMFRKKSNFSDTNKKSRACALPIWTYFNTRFLYIEIIVEKKLRQLVLEIFVDRTVCIDRFSLKFFQVFKRKHNLHTLANRFKESCRVF